MSIHLTNMSQLEPKDVPCLFSQVRPLFQAMDWTDRGTVGRVEPFKRAANGSWIYREKEWDNWNNLNHETFHDDNDMLQIVKNCFTQTDISFSFILDCGWGYSQSWDDDIEWSRHSIEQQIILETLDLAYKYDGHLCYKHINSIFKPDVFDKLQSVIDSASKVDGLKRASCSFYEDLYKFFATCDERVFDVLMLFCVHRELNELKNALKDLYKTMYLNMKRKIYLCCDW